MNFKKKAIILALFTASSPSYATMGVFDINIESVIAPIKAAVDKSTSAIFKQLEMIEKKGKEEVELNRALTEQENLINLAFASKGIAHPTMCAKDGINGDANKTDVVVALDSKERELKRQNLNHISNINRSRGGGGGGSGGSSGGSKGLRATFTEQVETAQKAKSQCTGYDVSQSIHGCTQISNSEVVGLETMSVVLGGSLKTKLDGSQIIIKERSGGIKEDGEQHELALRYANHFLGFTPTYVESKMANKNDERVKKMNADISTYESRRSVIEEYLSDKISQNLSDDELKEVWGKLDPKPEKILGIAPNGSPTRDLMLEYLVKSELTQDKMIEKGGADNANIERLLTLNINLLWGVYKEQKTTNQLLSVVATSLLNPVTTNSIESQK